MTATKLKVAIVGAGPGGLAAAIQFLRLPGVELEVFEQARELREVGAVSPCIQHAYHSNLQGISINQNTWRLLRELGAASALEQYTLRLPAGKSDHQQRNGRTGELLAESFTRENPDAPPRSRVLRTKLQSALRSRVPDGLIKLSKKLAKINETPAGVTLSFADGRTSGPFDLVVGADGIRSVVRGHMFPEHKLTYTGKVAFRVLVSQDRVDHIPGIPHSATFWHTPDTHVYTDPLDNGLFEIATRAIESEEHGAKVSWGRTVDRSQVIHHYKDYHETVRAIIDVPRDGEWLEFAMFGGPRLASVTRGGRFVLTGDASHPLSGAFGSGAAFAFEDAYVLARVLEYNKYDTAAALPLFDSIRAPRYEKLACDSGLKYMLIPVRGARPRH
jgi:salicylate hydroxylase